jgi:hypothetical protein
VVIVGVFLDGNILGGKAERQKGGKESKKAKVKAKAEEKAEAKAEFVGFFHFKVQVHLSCKCPLDKEVRQSPYRVEIRRRQR